MRQSPIVVAITGASGVVYARRLLHVLLELGEQVHLTISESGFKVIEHELQVKIDLDEFDLGSFLSDTNFASGQCVYHHFKDFLAPIASGSFLTRAMVVCPCSGSTLSGIATARNGNLVERAAEVHLKERRRLIIVPRETPLSLLQIRNMESVTLAGGVVLPASPGFYHGCESVADLVDFVVARIVDQLGIDCKLIPRWGG